jgi:cell division protein FtsX
VSAVRYAFEEAWASLRRAGRSAAISVVTIAIAFLALGGFLLVSVNVQRAIDRWLASAELSVYLKDDAPDDERTALEDYLKAQPVVVAVEFISKDRALARFQADFPELTDVATTLADNPFPAALEVRLRTGAATADEADALAKSVSGQPGVADVRYDRRWIERLLALVTGGRIAGAFVAGILILGAAFTVAAVVRLSLHARRDEIDIMQLVGAPFSFIRGPSVVEGLLLGGAGAAVALVLVWVLYLAIARSVGADMAGVIGEGGLRFLGVAETLLMLGGGLAVGAAAGVVASRAVK